MANQNPCSPDRKDCRYSRSIHQPYPRQCVQCGWEEVAALAGGIERAVEASVVAPLTPNLVPVWNKDRASRELDARNEYMNTKSAIALLLQKSRGELVKCQRSGDGHSSLIRDYVMSFDKLVDHINRMQP